MINMYTSKVTLLLKQTLRYINKTKSLHHNINEFIEENLAVT